MTRRKEGFCLNGYIQSAISDRLESETLAQYKGPVSIIACKC